MTEGISKERLIKLRDTINDRFESGTPTHNIYSLILNQLILECTELDPWLKIDENTPKEQDLLITDKSKRKYIGRLFSSGIWCAQGKLDFIPTHYKLLPGDTK